jgi:hypothetical protein
MFVCVSTPGWMDKKLHARGTMLMAQDVPFAYIVMKLVDICYKSLIHAHRLIMYFELSSTFGKNSGYQTITSCSRDFEP